MMTGCHRHPTFNCAYCKCVVSNQKAWISHLLQPRHQRKVLKRCKKWTDKIQRRVLITYSPGPVHPSKVIQLFSYARNKEIVADFIHRWADPYLGLFLFASRYGDLAVIYYLSVYKLLQAELQIKDSEGEGGGC